MIRTKRKPPIIRNNLEHHHCTKCDEYKPKTQFYLSARGDNKTHSRCKRCYSEYRYFDGHVKQNKKRELHLAWEYIRQDVTRLVLNDCRLGKPSGSVPNPDKSSQIEA